jgi:hypothetical protein
MVDGPAPPTGRAGDRRNPRIFGQVGPSGNPEEKDTIEVVENLVEVPGDNRGHLADGFEGRQEVFQSLVQPRLAGRTGAGCTAEAAKAMGKPLLFNASRGDGIPGD